MRHDAVNEKRKLTKKQKSRIGLLMTVILSAAIIAVGFLAAIWMERLVPSFKNETLTRELTAGVGLLPGGSDSIRMSLSPWNLYDPAKMVPLTDKALYWLKTDMDIDGFLSFMIMDNTWELDHNGDGFRPSQIYDFSEKFTMLPDKEGEPLYLYLDEERVTLPNGDQVDVSCVISVYSYPQLSYYAAIPVRDSQADLSEAINRTYQSMKERFDAYAEKYEIGQKEGILDAASLNELTGIDLQKLFLAESNYSIAGVSEYVSMFFQRSELLLSPEILRTEQELLLIYTSQYNGRIVVFIDPLTGKCCGLSIQAQ